MPENPTCDALEKRVRELEAERKRLVDALDEQKRSGPWQGEERFRTLIENVVDWVWQVDARGTYTYVSPQAETLLGYPAGEILGKTPFHFMSPPEAERIAPVYAEAVQGRRRILGLEDVLLARDGTEVVFETNATPLFDDQGGFAGYMGTCRDVTRRTRAEEARRLDEARLEALLRLNEMQAAGPDQIAEYALEESARLTGSDIGFINFLSDDEQLVTHAVYTQHTLGHCELPKEVSAFEISECGLWSEACRRRRPVTVNDYDQDHAAKAGFPPGHPMLRRFVSIPVFEGSRVAAVAALGNKERPYDEGDVRQFRLFMEGLWQILRRKRAEEALLEREETYRALVEGLPDIVMRFDRDGRHLFVSESVEEVVELPAARFEGRTHRELGFFETHCRFWEEAIRRVFDEGVAHETDFSFEGRSGLRVFNWRLMPERDRHGAVRSVLSISRDVTEVRQAQQNYETLFKEMLNGFALHEIICDEEGRPADYRFLAVNPAFERLTGLRARDLLGRRVLEVLPETEQRWIDTYGRVALTGEPARFEEYACGLQKHFTVMAFQPAFRQFACIFEDITQQKQAEADRRRLEEQLRQAHKMEAIGTLAGGIAHDFNNILGIIVGNTELAMLDLPDWSPAQDSLKEVREATLRARDLVTQILLFARRKKQTVVRIQVEAVAGESMKMLRASIPATVEIREEIQDDLPPVSADPAQIQQVVLNLCTNAAQVMEAEGGTLVLTLDAVDLAAPLDTLTGRIPEGRFVRLRVRDTGPGIAPGNLERIFEPFFTTKGVGEGTGLGLAVVHGIVQDRNGGLTVESREGMGTTFTVLLPAAGKVPFQQPAEEAPPIPGGREHILFVDDEPMILKLGRRMLERQGYLVEARSSGVEALERFKEDPSRFDLVVTDMTMPGMRGDQLAREILSIRPGTPVILCTGYSKHISEERAEALGVRAFVMKPLTQHALTGTVRRVLDAPSALSS